MRMFHDETNESGATNVIEHEIILENDTPIRPQYRTTRIKR
jgi:hypothetical protein